MGWGIENRQTSYLLHPKPVAGEKSGVREGHCSQKRQSLPPDRHTEQGLWSPRSPQEGSGWGALSTAAVGSPLPQGIDPEQAQLVPMKRKKRQKQGSGS